MHLQGADRPLVETTPRFKRTLPLDKALHPDTILAYEMNGEPLPHLHGYPLRVVAPGWVGDDWVKWLSELTVADSEPDTFWYQTAYRYPKRPLKHGEKVDPATDMAPMEEMVVKSLIAKPGAGERVGLGPVEVLGVAWTGGDARINRVDVSVDGGRTWTPAELLGEDLPYAWRQWRLGWRPSGPGDHTLLARATDTRGATQPLGEAPWNPSGYHWNAADAVTVTVKA
ncbi:MAG: molybdopterin-dependent oxidoreductase [Candidatus Sericytochromatia bacterium]